MLMPAYRAADGLRPTARNSKPLVERKRSHDTTTSGGEQRQDQAPVRAQARSKSSGQCAVGLDDLARSGRSRPGALEERRAQREVDGQVRDVVEHDRRDHLVGARHVP